MRITFSLELKSIIERKFTQYNLGFEINCFYSREDTLEITMKDICFDIKAIILLEIDIDNMDLSSILFNTIDNAIEAYLNYSGK